MERSSFAGELLDGVSARPRPGTVEIQDDELVFRPDDGAATTWSLSAVRDIRRVASEVHVGLEPLRDGDDESPAAHRIHARLVVRDRDFERVLDEARGRFSLDTGVTLRAGVRRLGWRGWLVLAAVVVPLCWVLYAALLPRAHVFISKEQEARLGEAIYQAVTERWEAVEDEEFDALVARMATELRDPAARFDIRITLVDEDVPNAFAAPGGRIVVFSGLLKHCPTADTLAGVLAHEIAHVEERHGLKHLLRTLGILFFAGAFVGGGIEEFETAEAIAELSSGLLILRHSRTHESEADRIAVAKLVRAGRDARGLTAFFAGLAPLTGDVPGWLSTHPVSEDRIAAIEALAGDPDPDARPWLPQADWDALRARLTR